MGGNELAKEASVGWVAGRMERALDHSKLKEYVTPLNLDRGAEDSQGKHALTTPVCIHIELAAPKI
jgi:hypothetical protein